MEKSGAYPIYLDRPFLDICGSKSFLNFFKGLKITSLCHASPDIHFQHWLLAVLIELGIAPRVCRSWSWGFMSCICTRCVQSQDLLIKCRCYGPSSCESKTIYPNLQWAVRFLKRQRTRHCDARVSMFTVSLTGEECTVVLRRRTNSGFRNSCFVFEY